MALTQAQQDRAADVNRVQQRRLQAMVLGAVELAWHQHGGPDDEQADAYRTQVLTLVRGGQSQSARMAYGYTTTLLLAAGGRALPLSRRPLQLASLLVADDAPVAVSPVLRVRTLLGGGEAFPDAMQRTGRYARELASGDLQAAMRGGMDQGAAGARVRGWRKTVDPSCCAWCSLVGSDRIYKRADTVPFHDNDHCGVEPVLAN